MQVVVGAEAVRKHEERVELALKIAIYDKYARWRDDFWFTSRTPIICESCQEQIPSGQGHCYRVKSVIKAKRVERAALCKTTAKEHGLELVCWDDDGGKDFRWVDVRFSKTKNAARQ